MLSDLAKAGKNNIVIEADVIVLGTSVADPKYDRPANPALSILGDYTNEEIINFTLVTPGDDPIILLVKMLVDFILNFGAPKEIKVSNVIMEAALEQVCNVCGIKIRRVKKLRVIDDFKHSFYRFRY